MRGAPRPPHVPAAQGGMQPSELTLYSYSLTLGRPCALAEWIPSRNTLQ